VILLPVNALSEDKVIRSKFLHEYFAGQFVSSTLINNSWAIEHYFPDISDYYIDPYLSQGLTWWQGAMDFSDIPFAIRKEEGFQLSLNDSWTLLAWSQWLSTYTSKIGMPSEIIILHVDDHDDLMSPLVWDEDSRWIDATTRRSIDILNPDSITHAIKSGSIGIGSFIVPLLHVIPKVQIRHLCATSYSVTRQGCYSLTPTLVPDQLLNASSKRIAVELNSRGDSNLEVDNKSTYQVTADLDEWLQDLPTNVPILLHIDMDYFNNRFNGDSDWELYGNSHNPSCEEVIKSVNIMFNALSQSNLIDKICDTTVALSPGFFPAELWEPSVDCIRYYLSNKN
jgi:hypothetical protein